jgi:hypothetical protein
VNRGPRPGDLPLQSDGRHCEPLRRLWVHELRIGENRARNWLLAFLPLAALVSYGLWITSYSRYLTFTLRYRAPPIARAPEDVLGASFWLPWSVFCVAFLFSLTLAIAYRERRVVFALGLSSLFGLLSLLDFFLYTTLRQQVLGSS